MVGTFVPKLTKKVFEKYGFSAATLLTDWAAIVGPDIAVFTCPERLKWQRGVETYGAVEDDAVGRPGATLVMRVEGSRAIDVQMRSRQIIERINGYFGYRAVTELRLVQGPVASLGAMPPRAARTTSPRQLPQPSAALVATVEDEQLRAALARLGASVAAERAERRQGS